MLLIITERAGRDYGALPKHLQTLTDKQFAHLTKNLKYPSLHAKKYDPSQDIWQGRIDRRYRFYFVIVGDAYAILSITKHPK